MNRRHFLTTATATAAALTGCTADASEQSFDQQRNETSGTPESGSTTAFHADLEAEGIDVLDLYQVMGKETFVAYVHDEQTHARDLAVTAVTFAEGYTHLSDGALTISPGVPAGDGYEKHGYTYVETPRAKRFARGELSRKQFVSTVQERYQR